MRVLDVIEVEFSRLGFPALEALLAFVSIQPWLFVSVEHVGGVGIPAQELARGLVRGAAAGVVGRLYLPTSLVIAGYLSYSTFSDFGSGLAQTLLSYPLSRRTYLYTKLLAALAVAAVPAAYSAALWTASLVEERLSWTPLGLIAASVALQALPVAAWSLAASTALRKNFIAAAAISAAPWVLLARLRPEGAIRYALPSAYPSALAAGHHLPAVLSSLSVTLACLGLLEIELSRLEVD